MKPSQTGEDQQNGISASLRGKAPFDLRAPQGPTLRLEVLLKRISFHSYIRKKTPCAGRRRVGKGSSP